METVYQCQSTIYPERLVCQVASDEYLLRGHDGRREIVPSYKVTKIVRQKRIYVHKASQEIIPSENVIEDECYWIKMREGVGHYDHHEIEIQSPEEKQLPVSSKYEEVVQIVRSTPNVHFTYSQMTPKAEELIKMIMSSSERSLPAPPSKETLSKYDHWPSQSSEIEKIPIDEYFDESHLASTINK